MFLRTALFFVAFVLIAPQSRSFVVSCFENAGDQLHAWGTTSYVVISVVAVALLASMCLLQNWPRLRDTEARYRRSLED